MPRREMSFPAERIHEARRRHMLGASQQEIAEVLGTSQGTAGRRIKEWGWGPARIRGFRPCPPKFAFVMDASDIMGDSVDDAPDEPEPDLSARLKRLVAREMKRVEVCGGAPLDVARTLSSLAQTLKLLSSMPAIYEREPEEMDIAEFERDIVRRLDALRMEGQEEPQTGSAG